MGLFAQKDLVESIEKAERRIKREKKDKEKEKKSKKFTMKNNRQIIFKVISNFPDDATTPVILNEVNTI